MDVHSIKEIEPRGEKNRRPNKGFTQKSAMTLTFYISSLIQSHCTPFTYRQSYDKICALAKTTLCPNEDFSLDLLVKSLQG